MFDIIRSYHCMQFQRKHMILIQENGAKSHFRHDRPKFGPAIFFLFFKNSFYHNAKYQKKANDPILRKLCDGRAESQTDESDFIGRWLIDAKRTITISKHYTCMLHK